MVELLNAKPINYGIMFEDEEDNPNMPKLFKKVVEKPEIPHFPNVDKPMTEEEINEFKRKHPEQFKEEFKEVKKKQDEIIKSENAKLKQIPTTETESENIEKFKRLSDKDLVKKNNTLTGDIYMLENATNNYLTGYWAHKLGNCNSYCANRNGNSCIIIGPRAYIFFIISLMIQICVWGILYFYSEEFNKKIKNFGIICSLGFQLFFTYTFLINPGFPKNTKGRQTGSPEDEYKFCSTCKIYVRFDKKVKHCFKCELCIEGRKFHSIILSKCIGRNNFCSYIISMIFLTGSVSFIIYTLIQINK